MKRKEEEKKCINFFPVFLFIKKKFWNSHPKLDCLPNNDRLKNYLEIVEDFLPNCNSGPRHSRFVAPTSSSECLCEVGLSDAAVPGFGDPWKGKKNHFR